MDGIWLAIFGAGTGGLVSGFLIGSAMARPREPSDADVAHTAKCYREWYGDEALVKLGEHMLAATFVRDGRHRAFLKRVASSSNVAPE